MSLRVFMMFSCNFMKLRVFVGFHSVSRRWPRRTIPVDQNSKISRFWAIFQTVAKLGPVGSDCPKVFRLLSVSVQFAWNRYLELYAYFSEVSAWFVGYFPPRHAFEVAFEGPKLTSFFGQKLNFVTKFCRFTTLPLEGRLAGIPTCSCRF